MIARMVSVVLIAATVQTGWASQYAEGVFPRVVATRQAGRTAMDLPAILPPVDGYVAVVECERIGDVVWLRPEGSDDWESFLIADCSGSRETTDWMLRNNILVEVDYRTAYRWDAVDEGKRIEYSEEEVERGRSGNADISCPGGDDGHWFHRSPVPWDN